MTDKVRYLQKTITVSTALPMPHTAGSTTTQRLYLKSSKTSAVNRAARPKTGAGSTSRPEKLHSVFTEQSHAGASYPAFSSGKPAESLAQPGYLLIQFSFSLPVPELPRLHSFLPLSSACWMVRVGGIGQSKPKPVHKRAERFTQSCWTEPSGALWACASDKAAQLQVHGFVSTPGPSCFRVGSMFSGVPIHRIAGAFEPNRALVTVASREAR
jgi:hypothetical protein